MLVATTMLQSLIILSQLVEALACFCDPSRLLVPANSHRYNKRRRTSNDLGLLCLLIFPENVPHHRRIMSSKELTCGEIEINKLFWFADILQPSLNFWVRPAALKRNNIA